MLQTYQTKLRNIQLNDELSSDRYLKEYGEFFGMLERKLFVQTYIDNNSSTSLKKAFLKQYGITSRQFNSIRMQLDGKVSSFLEKRKLDVKDLQSKTHFLQTVIDKKTAQKDQLHQKLPHIPQKDPAFPKLVKKYRNIKFYIHQKKRRLRNLLQKVNKLKSDMELERIRICFGFKKLFHKQFQLEENGYNDHQSWRQEWLESRSSQFLVIGSKDETFGNQSATYNLENILRLRVANRFVEKYGKHIEFPNLTFPYGQQWLDKAKNWYIGHTRSGKLQKYFTSITYRFIKKKNRWYVNATVDRETPEIGTSNVNGLIGIDLNAGFLSICEIDRYGNPIKSWTIKVPMYNRRKEQVRASLSDAITEILDYAVLVQKDVMIEKLNFSRKKTQLREMGPNYARMLSGFAYSTFQQLIEAKAKKAGVRTKRVNPAYTSQIGHMKFMARYGLSSHTSAACMIARRGYRFKTEQPNYDTVISLPKNFDNQKSNFSNWASITKYVNKKYYFHDKIEILKADI